MQLNMLCRKELATDRNPRTCWAAGKMHGIIKGFGQKLPRTGVQAKTSAQGPSKIIIEARQPRLQDWCNMKKPMKQTGAQQPQQA